LSGGADSLPALLQQPQEKIIHCLASIGWLEPAFNRTAEKQLHQALISARLDAPHQILAAVQALDIELIAGLDAVRVADFGRDYDLALA
jgi:hypothetical protein